MRLRSYVLLLTVFLMVGNAQAAYKKDMSDRQFWPRNQGIRVCWAPSVDPNGSLQKRIRATVEDGWGRWSSIWFEDWGACESSTPEGMPRGHVIYIRPTIHSDGHSESVVGRAFGLPGDGSPARPTVIDLNFNAPARSFCDLGPGGNSNDDCVTWTAFHEFGHALGFLHEHARPEFPGCGFPDVRSPFFGDRRSGGGINVTSYDPTSVMNYCSSNGNNMGRLSHRDIAGLQALYGFKPRGAMVGPGGRCLDVDNRDVRNGTEVQMWHCWGGDNQRWIWSQWDGTLSPDIARWACLDEGSFGQTPGTPLDIWECPNRAVPRWQMERQLAVHGLGHTGLRISGFNAEFQHTALRWWTYTPDHQLQVFQRDLCLTFHGQEGSQPFVTNCDPNRTDQKVFLNHWGGLSTWEELCLEITDNDAPPFRIDIRTPARLALCNPSKMTQQFYFDTAPLRNSHGWCMGHQPSDGGVIHNGLRPAIDACPAYFTWQYYFGPF